jgi:hypothetical protein
MGNSKLQTPNSIEASSSKPQAVFVLPALFGDWDLEFPWSLEFGVWSFVLGDGVRFHSSRLSCCSIRFSRDGGITCNMPGMMARAISRRRRIWS